MKNKQEVVLASDASEVAIVNPVAPILQMIERLVVNPDADVDKLERMVLLQERMLDRDQEAAFNRAMVLAQKKMPIIEKKSKNAQTKSLYAKLDQVNAAIVPIYTKQGFAVSFNTRESSLEDHIKIVALVCHREGFSREYSHDLPIDNKGMQGSVNKTLMHGRASTVSYGQRYLLTMIFNIATGTDVDGNATQASGSKPVVEPSNKKLWEGAKAAFERDSNFDRVRARATLSPENEKLLMKEMMGV